MKRIIAILSALMMSSLAFAAATSSNLGNNSDTLSALGSAWNNKPTLNASQNKHDLTIVYGGADVGDRATLAGQHSAV